MTDGVPASVASVTQVLEQLDGPFEGLAIGVAEGSYALWLGSGISLARVDGLRGVIRRVLCFVQQRVEDPEDCPYRRALVEILELANRAGMDTTAIDCSTEVDQWPGLDQLIELLLSQYSSLLDVRVQGQRRDHLLWDAVDVVGTYGTGAQVADAEHLSVAILATEGVAPQIASANWDCLLEAAFEDLGYSFGELLKVAWSARTSNSPNSARDS